MTADESWVVRALLSGGRVAPRLRGYDGSSSSTAPSGAWPLSTPSCLQKSCRLAAMVMMALHRGDSGAGRRGQARPGPS